MSVPWDRHKTQSPATIKGQKESIRDSHTVKGYFCNSQGSLLRKLPEGDSESDSFVSDSLRLHGLYSPWYSPGQNTGVGSRSLLQSIFSIQGSNPGLLHCRQILYQLSPGKPKNTAVGSLSLLHGIFLTQESNRGLLHCRLILYQLSYQGSLISRKQNKSLIRDYYGEFCANKLDNFANLTNLCHNIPH